MPLPTRIRKYTVLRSLHVNKDSREQFEMRVHRRMIELVNSTDKAISSLTSVHLPSWCKDRKFNKFNSILCIYLWEMML
ncbi:SSU ribosomal protein S10P [Fusobacterium vincentii ATCC 49256]|uniref:30S ribosomal protein S10 n=1 Tax=Fusobacterium vincentii ATCC 49256 TaxID=209882 RepID=Q7P3J2_FUSVC|nr:SSU ribosomal protein S10P [Fusobacterium vincentii ATCC 49256]